MLNTIESVTLCREGTRKLSKVSVPTVRDELSNHITIRFEVWERPEVVVAWGLGNGKFKIHGS